MNSTASPTGTLYMCATPIGNLEDMTYRAVRILREVSVIAAEDTRHTRKLLSHFDIHTQMISYHEHNKAVRGPELVERLLTGEDIAVVSDAGLPGISDPGADLVQLALEAGVKVSPVPGANAALSGLICSGLDTRMFLFVGFLPKSAKKRRELLYELAELPYTLMFYESPHRLTETLKEISEALSDRPAVAGRELTKKFEEFSRGTISTIAAEFAAKPPRGEFTLIVAGHQGVARSAKVDAVCDPVSEVLNLINAGVPKKEAIRQAANKLGKSRREIYQLFLSRPDE